MTEKIYRLIVAVLTTGLAAQALADSAADDANKSNNPLHPAVSFNIHNYYTPNIYGIDGHTYDLLLRPTVPFAPGEIIPVPQIVRFTVPVSNRPQAGGGYTTSLGDISVFDIFLLGKFGGVELGVGPLLTIPTAGKDETGTGKWQAGLAAIAISPTTERLIGGLIQWQQSFAGDSDRPSVGSVTFQPFLIYNLPQGWYLRSTAIWTFNIKNGDYAIPLGLGVGKTWRAGKTIFNFFAEPQWTVAHDGEGLPKFSVFVGLNMSFGQ